MDLIFDDPGKYLLILCWICIFFPTSKNMKNEDKDIFFNILSKTQLISIFVLLIISSVNFTNNLNSVKLSHIYFIITVNILIALVVFYFRLDKFIDKILKKCMGNSFINLLLIILWSITLSIYAFSSHFYFIRKHTPTILTVVFALLFFNAKYTKYIKYTNDPVDAE